MSPRTSLDSPLLLPTTAYPSPPPSRSKRRLAFLTASRRRLLLYLAGFVLGAILLQQVSRRIWKTTPSWNVPGGGRPRPIYVDSGGGVGSPGKGMEGDAVVEVCRPSAALPVVVEEPAEEWPLERLREMVAGTKGYYARDYSLWLGWNNIRYIIEAGLVQAEILNRTLIVPSFIYARGCEFELNACAAFAEMVNRGDAINWDEWRDWPMDKQMGWKIPMEMMIDMTHLRETHPVVTVSQFLRLRGLSPDLEKGNGQWDDATYHAPSHLIGNTEWDPHGVVRVDRIPPAPGAQIEDAMLEGGAVRVAQVADQVKAALEEELKKDEKFILEWQEAKDLFAGGSIDLRRDLDFERALSAAGFVVLHTFQGSRGFDLIKSVVEPIKQIASRSSLKGLSDDYGSLSAEIVHLQGETHLYRKPGNLRFTSEETMDGFARTVLYSLRPLPEIAALAERVDERMKERTGGRLWMAAHMRRGDFVTYHWTENSLENHVKSIKDHLRHGPEVWFEIRQSHAAVTFDVPDVSLNRQMFEGEVPRETDPFYIATDERDPAGLAYIRSQGGVLISDLLLPEDRNIVGWPLLITDILALVEQQAMSRAAYFYGFGASSVAGGVLNLRALHGWDPRTTVVD